MYFDSFAIREGTTKVKLFRNFKERKSFKPEFGAEGTQYLYMHPQYNFVQKCSVRAEIFVVCVFCVQPRLRYSHLKFTDNLE